MILDFLKKYRKFIYFILGLDLFSIILITKIYLHTSIKMDLLTFIFMTAFWTFLWLGFHKFRKIENTKAGNRTEGNILLDFIFIAYTSITFFVNPVKYIDFGGGPFFFMPDLLCCIFFTQKYNIDGCWFKKQEES